LLLGVLTRLVLKFVSFSSFIGTKVKNIA
jgi:hypothetical protein